MVARASRVSAEAVFVEKVRIGTPLLDAAVATMRALIGAKDHYGARAFAIGMAELPQAETLERLGRGLVMHSRIRFGFGWDQFKLVDARHPRGPGAVRGGRLRPVRGHPRVARGGAGHRLRPDPSRDA